MKKNSFLEGAFIATISVILCKILGLVYVIPFHAIIGDQGGALYSYAYSIYSVFLNLATIGIPTAISKIVSEYNALGYFKTKERAYKIGSKLIIFIGIISFILLFIFAPIVAKAIKGNATDGNSVESIALVIRAIATALIIVPMLSVRKGYMQGHKFMTIPQLSTVIEQIVRVIIVIAGSYTAYKIFNLSLDWAVAIAVFGATVGALSAYFFVERNIKKNKDQFYLNEKAKPEEKTFTRKILLKKIVYYALPFVLIDLVKSVYDLVDLFTVVGTLTKVGYETSEAENVFGTISTWASKLNMIIISISIGVTASLIPNIMPSFVKKDFKDVSKKINQALQILILITIPMTIGLCILSYPVWNAFYGYNEVGMNLLSVYVFLALTMSFQSILVESAQIMNNTKLTLGSLILGVIIKFALNVPLIYLFHNMGIESYYAPTVASIISQAITIVYLLYALNRKYQVNYSSSVKILWKSLVSVAIMTIVLLLMNFILPIKNESRIMSSIICAIYGIVGAIIYFLAILKFKTIPNLTSVSDCIKIIKKKLRKTN